jgi:CrcB protein
MASANGTPTAEAQMSELVPVHETLDEIEPGTPAARHPAHVLAAVCLGGALGTLARTELGRALPVDGDGWPWATFAVNAAGAFVLGAAVPHLRERLPVSTVRRYLVGTGFCGGLTTFSTLQIELLRLARHGHAALAAGYLGASLAAGFGLLFAATLLARRLW